MPGVALVFLHLMATGASRAKSLTRRSKNSYSFTNLVEDITSRCSNLSYLNPLTIRIIYQDDEGSLINQQYGDDAAFCEMWNKARVVTDRDYKRIKIKACEADSPAFKAAKASMISCEKNVATVKCATAERLHQRNNCSRVVLKALEFH